MILLLHEYGVVNESREVAMHVYVLHGRPVRILLLSLGQQVPNKRFFVIFHFVSVLIVTLYSCDSMVFRVRKQAWFAAKECADSDF